MRVVLLANAASPHTQRWAGALLERGVEVHVVSIRDAVISGVPVHRVGVGDPGRRGALRSLLSYLRLLLRARRIIGDIDPDVVNAHYSVTHGAIAVFARLRPVVLTVWGTDVVWGNHLVRGPKRWLNRFVMGRVDAVTASSRFLVNAVREIGAGNTPIHLVPFGVDTAVFFPARDRGSARRIGFVKRFDLRYDPLTLVDAFAAMTDTSWRLVMVGGGPLEARLRRRAVELGVDGRVEIQPAVNLHSVPDLMRGLDILVNPSRSESFGVVMLEASASGVPVVATKVGGTAETVIDGETGLVVPVGDTSALAAALDALAADASLRTRLGTAGRRFVETTYEWRDCVEAMVGVLQGVDG